MGDNTEAESFLEHLDSEIRRSCYRTSTADPLGLLIAVGFMNKIGYRDDSMCQTHYSLIYVLRGRGTYKTEDGRSWELGPGSCFQRFAGIPQTLLIDPESNWREGFIAFGEIGERALSACGLARENQPVLQVGHSPVYERMLEEIYSILNEQKEGNESLAFARGIEFVSRVYESSGRNDDRQALAAEMEEACRLLSRNPRSRAPIEDIVAPLSIGYETFRRQFLSHTGMSPGAYRLRRRIDEACSLLQGSDLSVSEIASLLGYKTAHAFSAQFAKIMGVPPRKFRKGY